MKRNINLQQILWSHLDNLAATLRPNTVAGYATTVRRFVRFLESTYPELLYPSQLRRDPHILSFLQSLYQQQPPLKNGSRIKHLCNLRRLLYDMGRNGHRLPSEALILRDDFPAPDVYLPRPLPFEEDRLLQQQLTADNDLIANALMLLRATGLRIGECRHLTLDSLHCLSQHQWVLKIPLGKLHTERWLPVDDSTRQIIARITSLRSAGPQCDSRTRPFLLLWHDGQRPSYEAFRRRLIQAAQQAGCSSHVTPHRLRHCYASEMISAGVSLPAVMLLLGHKSIRMTLRYVQVSDNDLHTQYHRARERIATRHLLPKLPVNQTIEQSAKGGILALRNTLAAAQQLFENHRRQLSDVKDRKKLSRLANRLMKIRADLAYFQTRP